MRDRVRSRCSCASDGGGGRSALFIAASFRSTSTRNGSVGIAHIGQGLPSEKDGHRQDTEPPKCTLALNAVGHRDRPCRLQACPKARAISQTLVQCDLCSSRSRTSGRLCTPNTIGGVRTRRDCRPGDTAAAAQCRERSRRVPPPNPWVAHCHTQFTRSGRSNAWADHPVSCVRTHVCHGVTCNCHVGSCTRA